MARLAVDAPALLHLAAQDTAVDPAHQLVGTNAVRSQALQLLLDQVRAGTRSEQEARACHERMTRLHLRLLGDRVSRGTAWRLALEHGWSIVDAECVAVAKLQADALVCGDPRLAEKAAAVVPIQPLEALQAS
jgi:predicted nucleic acid-binding protein